MRERDFTLTAVLPLAPAATERSIAADLDVLRQHVDAVQVTDSPTGIPHMSPLVAASICLRHGVDPVMHLSGRDRNRIALQGDLLGAATLGVTSLFLMRGEKLPATLTPRAQRVYEFGAKRLLRCASLIGSETTLPPAGGFFLGAPVRVVQPPAGWQPRGIETKADVGCKFLQTQPVAELTTLGIFLKRLIASRTLERVSVVVSVPLVTTAEALAAFDERPNAALVGDDLRRALAAAGSPAEARAVGIRHCAALLAGLARVPGVAGANLTGFTDSRAAAEAISLSEIRP